MILARVDGSATTSHAHPSLRGWRLAICQPVDDAGTESGEPFLAMDPHHAGLHERVFVTTDGSSTAERAGDPHSPLRNMIVGILDN